MAYYAEKDFFEDDELIQLVTSILEGNLTLDWYRVDTPRVRARPADPGRGLTYEDCNLGPYGYDVIPEFLRDRYSMASRGSALVAKLPDLGYTVNRRSDVWADNVAGLYEEAKARRWAPAVDIPWGELDLVGDPLREAAMAQACTLLEEVALVAMEVPSRWVFSINQEFLELKSFLCAQMIDEARHVEACRKRALASGQGLGRAHRARHRREPRVPGAARRARCRLARARRARPRRCLRTALVHRRARGVPRALRRRRARRPSRAEPAPAPRRLARRLSRSRDIIRPWGGSPSA